jgi:hypothetical protein
MRVTTIQLCAAVLLLLGTATTTSVAQPELPSWTAPVLDPLEFPYGGARPLANVTLTRLFFAVPEIGTYNMSPMLDYFFGMFHALWKCSPRDEDQAGQRVLYSHSSDGRAWTPTDGTNEAFPNMSTTAKPAALFAEPFLHINGRVYAAASSQQFCLYPDLEHFSYLLLRQVYNNITTAAASGVAAGAAPTVAGARFGPLFWAAPTIPAGFEEASALRGVVTVGDMDAQTQADIAMLQDPGFAPCDPARGTTKCEYCLGGCQPWNQTKNVTGLENERTHFTVPAPSSSTSTSRNSGRSTAQQQQQQPPQVDVLLYRSRLHKDGPNYLHASVRAEPGAAWSPVQPTNITDDVANFNAGTLPDGRVYVKYFHEYRNHGSGVG